MPYDCVVPKNDKIIPPHNHHCQGLNKPFYYVGITYTNQRPLILLQAWLARYSACLPAYIGGGSVDHNNIITSKKSYS